MLSSITLSSSERQQWLTQLEQVHGAINERILSVIEKTLHNALSECRRLSLIRLDLRFAHCEQQSDAPTCFQYTDPQVITRFIASLNSQLCEQSRRKRQLGTRVYPCQVRYVWALEQHDAVLPHYHLILFLNKDAHAFLGRVQGNQSSGLVRIIQIAWCRALGLPYEDYSTLVHVPPNALTHLTQDDVLQRSTRYWAWLQWVGYLAKCATKVTGSGRRSFGASQG